MQLGPATTRSANQWAPCPPLTAACSSWRSVCSRRSPCSHLGHCRSHTLPHWQVRCWCTSVSMGHRHHQNVHRHRPCIPGVCAFEHVVLAGIDQGLLHSMYIPYHACGSSTMAARLLQAHMSLHCRGALHFPQHTLLCADAPHSRNTTPARCFEIALMAVSVNVSHPCIGCKHVEPITPPPDDGSA